MNDPTSFATLSSYALVEQSLLLWLSRPTTTTLYVEEVVVRSRPLAWNVGETKSNATVSLSANLVNDALNTTSIAGSQNTGLADLGELRSEFARHHAPTLKLSIPVNLQHSTLPSRSSKVSSIRHLRT